MQLQSKNQSEKDGKMGLIKTHLNVEFFYQLFDLYFVETKSLVLFQTDFFFHYFKV